jgi:hypothetical protein
MRWLKRPMLLAFVEWKALVLRQRKSRAMVRKLMFRMHNVC